MNQSKLEALWKKLVGPGAAFCALPVPVPPEVEGQVIPWLSQEDRAKFVSLTGAPRKREWLAGRACTMEVIARLGSPCVVSRSHTKDLAAALGCTSGVGVGIDLEKSDRKLSGLVVKRVMVSTELQLGFTPLQLWVIKEAVFKSCPDNHGQVVWDCSVLSAEEAKGPRGESVRFCQTDEGGYSWAFAHLS